MRFTGVLIPPPLWGGSVERSETGAGALRKYSLAADFFLWPPPDRRSRRPRFPRLRGGGIGRRCLRDLQRLPTKHMPMRDASLMTWQESPLAQPHDVKLLSFAAALLPADPTRMP